LGGEFRLSVIVRHWKKTSENGRKLWRTTEPPSSTAGIEGGGELGRAIQIGWVTAGTAIDQHFDQLAFICQNWCRLIIRKREKQDFIARQASIGLSPCSGPSRVGSTARTTVWARPP